MTDRLARALAAIDAANAADPTHERVGTEEVPAALLYGQRMSLELARIAPQASEVLRIAARGQHIERWLLPRTDFPAGKAGYLGWRTAQARAHAIRVAGIMAGAGYPPEDCARVGRLLRKEGLKRDVEVQMLEDALCFVFLRHHAAEFLGTRDPAKAAGIVAKTARKMSAAARARVLAEFALPPELAAAFRD